jgi:hypothetical protein
VSQNKEFVMELGGTNWCRRLGIGVCVCVCVCGERGCVAYGDGFL